MEKPASTIVFILHPKTEMVGTQLVKWQDSMFQLASSFYMTIRDEISPASSSGSMARIALGRSISVKALFQASMPFLGDVAPWKVSGL